MNLFQVSTTGFDLSDMKKGIEMYCRTPRHQLGNVSESGIAGPRDTGSSGPVPDPRHFLLKNIFKCSCTGMTMHQWFDYHLPGAVVSQGISRPKAEKCSGFPPPLDSRHLRSRIAKSDIYLHLVKSRVVTIIIKIIIIIYLYFKMMTY